MNLVIVKAKAISVMFLLQVSEGDLAVSMMGGTGGGAGVHLAQNRGSGT